MVGKFTSAVLRVVQLIFAVIVLGLSIAAVRWQYYNDVPATNGFASFAGAFGAFAGLLGLAAIWISPLGGMIMSIIDALATVFFLAGGIAYAVGLHGVNCSDGNDPGTWHNKLISGGCIKIMDDPQGREYQCGFFKASDVEHRCHMAEADTAFMFLGFLASLGAAILCLHIARTKKKTKTAV